MNDKLYYHICEINYEKLNKIRATLLKSIKAGSKIGETVKEVNKFASENNITLYQKNLGHSIGIELEEPPYLVEDEEEVFQNNMVFVLTPRIINRNDEIIANFDTIVIKDNKPQILGWYKNWHKPYIAQDSFPHGSG